MRSLLRQRLGHRPRRWLAGLAKLGCALVALAVLFGAGHVRTRYFYCEARGLSATDPCASREAHDPPCPLGSVHRAPFDCCRMLTMPTVPEGARSVAPTVPAAGIVAVLPPADAATAMSPTANTRFVWGDGRWRGPPRPAGERRARLMVFLT
ncbi:MAG TPA: hypothetical protein VGM06_06855 [Polyangiaceae bacterium]|jgi:hypothetical protein